MCRGISGLSTCHDGVDSGLSAHVVLHLDECNFEGLHGLVVLHACQVGLEKDFVPFLVALHTGRLAGHPINDRVADVDPLRDLAEVKLVSRVDTLIFIFNAERRQQGLASCWVCSVQPVEAVSHAHLLVCGEGAFPRLVGRLLSRRKEDEPGKELALDVLCVS